MFNDDEIILTRSEWGADDPPTRKPAIIPPSSRSGVVIHWNGPPLNIPTHGHSLADTRTADLAKAAAIHRYHRTKWSDGAYSFTVGQSGLIFEGRGLEWDQFANGSDQVGEDNGPDSEWYSILVLIGEGEEPTGEAIAAIAALVEGLRLAGAGTQVLPHNAFKVKTCPGPHLTALALSLHNKPTSPPPATVLARGSRSNDVAALQRMLVDEGHGIAIDGDFGPATEVALVAWQKSQGLTPTGTITWPQPAAVIDIDPDTTPPPPEAIADEWNRKQIIRRIRTLTEQNKRQAKYIGGLQRRVTALETGAAPAGT